MFIISVKVNNKTMTLLISVIIYTVIRKKMTSNNDTYNKYQDLYTLNNDAFRKRYKIKRH